MVSADLIREARLRAGFTQVELAERSGRERSVIARWEQGGSAPSLETMLDLLAVCGYDLQLQLAERDEDVLARLQASALLSPERRLERMLRAEAKHVANGDQPGSFDPYALFAALERHRIAYLLIGTLARVIRGTDELAHEFQITPSRQPPNLSRLQRALSDLADDHAGGDAHSNNAVLATDHGPLILTFEPAGYHRGYTDLRRAASREPIGCGLRPQVASAADLAGMLSAGARNEDQATIHALRHLTRLGA